jgi:hypothetical protein
VPQLQKTFGPEDFFSVNRSCTRAEQAAGSSENEVKMIFDDV